MNKPVQNTSLFERIAHGYFYGDGENQYIQNKYSTRLSQQQKTNLHKLKNRTFFLSAIAGTIGVILLYLPPYYFPGHFSMASFNIAIYNTTFSVPAYYLLYSLILTVAEIYLLVLFNIHAVRKVAVICDFPPKQDPNFHLHIKSLVKRGSDENAKKELSIGLNQWQGYSRFIVVRIFIWTMVRATVTNFVFKKILENIFAPHPIAIDLAGIPVMAFWNMWAANKVLRDAKVRILSPGIIQQTVMYLHKKYSNNQQFKSIIYDTLQFLAIRKRSFHANHYILSVNLLKTFQIPFKQAHHIPDNFVDTLKHLPVELHNDLAHLIIVGMIVDGHLSYLEKQSLDELVNIGIIDYSSSEIKWMMKQFLDGKGKDVLDHKLKMLVE